MPGAKPNKSKPGSSTALVDSIDAAGEQIEYMAGLCHYGSALVAATVDGICAVFLGDHPDQLYKELHAQFPNADFMNGDEEFEELLVNVINHIEKPDTLFQQHPLDIRGTPFQRKVWAALTGIPYGDTTTYSELAMQLGSPNAVRAVAQACAANKLAVIIPCHRVVRLDGDLSGYRWGIKRKQRLLDREQL